MFTDLRVDPDLFAVFGESVLNDAVAVVLYRAIQVLEDAFTLRNVLRAVWAFAVVFLGSTAVGVRPSPRAPLQAGQAQRRRGRRAPGASRRRPSELRQTVRRTTSR